ncbi:STAS domain-containing protein [Nocardia sp. KC 131]|uniref:STAS domain-containing protein n=1 Tax=Nocardia arseniciresistens TaxID=3392119 RepID=UPI00398F6579
MSTVVATLIQSIGGIAGPRHAGCDPSGRLQVTVMTPTDSITLCALVGEVDYYTAGIFRSRLIGSLRTAASAVVVDLSRVTFFGIAGLRVLTEVQARAGGTLALITGQRCVDRLLAAADEVATFRVVTSLAEAVTDAA